MATFGRLFHWLGHLVKISNLQLFKFGKNYEVCKTLFSRCQDRNRQDGRNYQFDHRNKDS